MDQLLQNLDMQQLEEMLGCDSQMLKDGMASLQRQGILDFKTIGKNENGEDLLEIKLLQEFPEIEAQVKEVMESTHH